MFIPAELPELSDNLEVLLLTPEARAELDAVRRLAGEGDQFTGTPGDRRQPQQQPRQARSRSHHRGIFGRA